MGRKKIGISFNPKERERKIQFNKRKIGLLKKAHELATLAGINVSLVFSDIEGCVHSFICEPDPNIDLKSTINTNEIRKYDNYTYNETDYPFTNVDNVPQVSKTNIDKYNLSRQASIYEEKEYLNKRSVCIEPETESLLSKRKKKQSQMIPSQVELKEKENKLENIQSSDFRDFYNNLEKFIENIYYKTGPINENIITTLVLKNLLDHYHNIDNYQPGSISEKIHKSLKNIPKQDFIDILRGINLNGQKELPINDQDQRLVMMQLSIFVDSIQDFIYSNNTPPSAMSPMTLKEKIRVTTPKYYDKQAGGLIITPNTFLGSFRNQIYSVLFQLCMLQEKYFRQFWTNESSHRIIEHNKCYLKSQSDFVKESIKFLMVDHTVRINQKYDNIRSNTPQVVPQIEESTLNRSYEHNDYKGMKIKQDQNNNLNLSVGKLFKQASHNSQIKQKYSDYDLSRLSAQKTPVASGINMQDFVPAFSPINAPQDTFNFNTLNLDNLNDFIFTNDNLNQGNANNNKTNLIRNNSNFSLHQANPQNSLALNRVQSLVPENNVPNQSNIASVTQPRNLGSMSVTSRDLHNRNQNLPDTMLSNMAAFTTSNATSPQTMNPTSANRNVTNRQNMGLNGIPNNANPTLNNRQVAEGLPTSINLGQSNIPESPYGQRDSIRDFQFLNPNSAITQNDRFFSFQNE